MEIQQLIYFRDLAETQNMRKTSENLHVTQSTISVAIKRLEEELTVELFDRKNRRLSLSEYGQIFLERVDLALYQLERGKEELKAAKNQSNNHIRISCPPYILTPDFIEFVYRAVPEAILEMKRMYSTAVYDDIVDGSIDMAVTGAQGPRSDRIEAVTIKRSRMCIVVAETHPLAMCKSVLISELRDTAFSSYIRQMGPRISLEEICRKNGFAPKVIFEASTITDVLQPVKSGTCVAYIPKVIFSVYNTAGLVCLDLADVDAYVDMQLCKAKDTPMRPIAEKTWNAIVDYCRTHTM